MMENIQKIRIKLENIWIDLIKIYAPYTPHNYHMHEHKTLAVLEALMKWEDKLLGRKFMVVTDHKGLEYFKT